MKDKKQNIVSRVLVILITLCMVLPATAIFSGNAVAESNNNFEIYGNSKHIGGDMHAT